MATEYPPLGKSYVISYSNNDRDYAIIGIRKDPRVDNYKIPADLSPHPDSARYPNHVFTGANPTNSDERVLWVYEILPSPWVPFTRYDDELGPIQGRRRSVKNEGQIASLAADKRTTYEAREGSAIVYTELEESWSIKTDDDGNSLFPVRIRDFYDSSRGAVEERRQLIVPTGEEVATLENVNGVITQTSYESYNEYLSFKVVQTYSVDGPQLVGQSTDNDGQLVTVTTQRKASDNYTAPQPTATKAVEVSREDTESLVERVVDTPELFDSKVLSASKPDVIPERFRASIPNETTVEVKEGASVTTPTLGENDFEKTIQRQTVHTIRETTTSRDPLYVPEELSGIEYEESFDVGIPFVERISNSLENDITADISPIGDGKYLVREYNKDEIESSLESFNESYPTRINLAIPPVLKSISLTWDVDENSGEQEQETQAFGSFSSISIGDNGSCNASISITPQFNLNFEDISGTNIFATTYLFFIKGPVTVEKIMEKCNAEFTWPVFKTKSYNITTKGVNLQSRLNGSISYSINSNPYGVITSTSKEWNKTRAINNIILNIKPCIHGEIEVIDGDGLKSKTATAEAKVKLEIPSLGANPVFYDTESDLPPPSEVAGQLAYILDTEKYFYSDGSSWTQTGAPSGPSLVLGDNGEYTVEDTITVDINLTPTTPNDIPRNGIYLVDSNVEPYKYGFYLIRAVTIDASIFAEVEV